MTDKQKEIAKLIWDFGALREEHILKLCKCTENDINCVIASKAISKEKNTNILKYQGKEVNNRIIVAFDVVMNYLDRNAKVKKAKHPVNVTMKTDFHTYDIIAIKEAEIEPLFENIDKISNSERIIIIIETKEYFSKEIHTKRPYCVCIYPSLEIEEIVNV